MQKRYRELIDKFQNNTISAEEMTVLEKWISKPENRNAFEEEMQLNHLINFHLVHTDSEKSLADIRKRIQEEKVKRPLWLRPLLKYAAVLMILLTIGYLYYESALTGSEALIIHDEQITLLLDDGTIKFLDSDTSQQILTNNGQLASSQEGDQLVYTGDATLEELSYHTLNVPYGKRFEVRLSDGTHIHLNAGTSLRYPIKFLPGHERKVFLTGEAFFDVVTDRVHPFVVNAEKLQVQVVGTRFNVAAYPEDATTDVVLVEGSVGLYTGDSIFDPDGGVILQPSSKGAMDKSDLSITTGKVNTTIHTAWIGGELVFRNMPFDNILKKLERQFNITIINENTALGRTPFNASFGAESIENILNYFNETHEIQYHIKDNEVIIK